MHSTVGLTTAFCVGHRSLLVRLRPGPLSFLHRAWGPRIFSAGASVCGSKTTYLFGRFVVSFIVAEQLFIIFPLIVGLFQFTLALLL